MNPYEAPISIDGHKPFKPRTIRDILRGDRLDLGSLCIGVLLGTEIGAFAMSQLFRYALAQAGVLP